MKKVFATLRALVDVMEALSKDADPHGAGRHIMEEVTVSYLLFYMDHQVTEHFKHSCTCCLVESVSTFHIHADLGLAIA
jgi:hypothetical protein